MSATTPCTPCCSDTQTINTPGTQGNSSVTTTTAAFTIPAVGSTVAISVGDTSWLKAKANVFISDGSKWGTFLVAIGSSTSITGTFLGFQGDSAAGGSIGSGAIVMPGVGDLTFPNDLDLLSAFTDNSGGTKSDTIAASLIKQTIIFPVQFTDFVNATTLKLAVPFAFTVSGVLLRVSKAGTGAGASVTLQTQINAVAATGGSVNPTLANAATVGATVAGSAITGANTGTAGQTLELAVTVGTVFTAGDGWFEFTVTNNDLAATLAAIAFKANQLRTALRHI